MAGVFAGGAVTYVMVYLLALSKLEGVGNVLGPCAFLVLNGFAVAQVARRLVAGPVD